MDKKCFVSVIQETHLYLKNPNLISANSFSEVLFSKTLNHYLSYLLQVKGEGNIQYCSHCPQIHKKSKNSTELFMHYFLFTQSLTQFNSLCQRAPLLLKTNKSTSVSHRDASSDLFCYCKSTLKQLFISSQSHIHYPSAINTHYQT